MNSRRLWAGAVAGAAIAALVAVLVDLVVNRILQLQMLSPWGDPVGLLWLVSAAVLATLLATATLQFVMLTMPQPLLFFGWIIGLAVVVFTLIPFAGGTFSGDTLATSLGNLAIGSAIGLSVEFAGSSAYQGRQGQQ